MKRCGPIAAGAALAGALLLLGPLAADAARAAKPATAQARFEEALGAGRWAEARDFVEDLGEPGARTGALAALAQGLTKAGQDEAAAEALRAAYAAADGAAPPDVRDRLVAPLIRAAASGDAGLRRLAFDWSLTLRDPALRRAAMRTASLSLVADRRVGRELVDVLGSLKGLEQAVALERLVDGFLAERRFERALIGALAVGDAYADRRDAALLRILAAQVEAGDRFEDIHAPLALRDAQRRDEALARLARLGVEKRRLAAARGLADLIGDAAHRLSVLQAMAAWLAREGYGAQLGPALDAAEAVALLLPPGPARTQAFEGLAGLAADADAIGRAEAFLARTGDPASRARIEARIATAYLARGDLKAAGRIAQGLRAGALRDPILAGLVERYLTREEPRAAAAAALRVQTPADRVGVEVSYAERAQRGRDIAEAEARLARARMLAEGLPAGPLRDHALFRVAQALARAGQWSAADALAREIRDAGWAEKARLAHVEAVAQVGRYEAALMHGAALSTQAGRGRVARVVARSMASRGEIRPAVELALTIANDRLRVSALREIAERQALVLDRDGLLKRGAHGTPPRVDDEPLPPGAAGDDWIVHRLPERALGEPMPPVPPLAPFTARSVRALVPPIAPGSVQVLPVHFSAYHEKFSLVRPLGHTDNEIFEAAQATRSPRFILVESGVVDMPALHARLIAAGAGDLIARSNRTYELKAPLVVGPEATLVVSNADVDTLRLNTNRGAFLINAGQLFVVAAGITSFDEATGAPTPRRQADRHLFNPFITAWSGSKTFIAQARIEGLGYADIKSYGLSLSSGPRDLAEARGYTVTRPTGMIVDNTFIDMFYGFYSYEADDIVLVGNEYARNEVYGIDPHDRSLRLIVAYNTTHHTRQKHGIIGSREVNQSYWIGNVSFRNRGSGLMLDRKSIDNLVYANHVFDNGQDGLSVFESACNLLARNASFGNERDGVKIRNSWDVALYSNRVADNRGYGVNTYSVRLEDVADQVHRDFAYDPYHPYASALVQGNEIARNAAGGVMARETVAMTLRNNRLIGQGRKLFLGDLARMQPLLVSGAAGGVAVVERCPPARPQDRCGLREQGYLGPAVPAPGPAGGAEAGCERVNARDGAPEEAAGSLAALTP